MLSDLQRRKLTHKFRIFDLDGDGWIEASDFRGVVDRLARLRGWEEGSEPVESLRAEYAEFWKALAAMAEPREPDRIDLDDWLDYYGAALDFEREISGPDHVTCTPRSTMGLVFDVLDRDGDGAISRREYREFCRAYRIELPAKGDTFSRLDRDGDGRITRSEMLDLVSDFYFSDDPQAPGNRLFGSIGSADDA